jgi:hypothetical protein
VTVNDRHYFVRRAAEERAAAERAEHKHARESHLQLAQRYEVLAAAAAGEPVVLLTPKSARAG